MCKAKKAGGGDTYVFNIGNGNQINQQQGLQNGMGPGGLRGPQGIKRLAAMLMRALNGSTGCGQAGHGHGGGCCGAGNPNFGCGGNSFNGGAAFSMNLGVRGFLG